MYYKKQTINKYKHSTFQSSMSLYMKSKLLHPITYCKWWEKKCAAIG